MILAIIHKMFLKAFANIFNVLNTVKNFSKNRVVRANMDVYDLTLKHPFSCIVSGCSGSGKTTWVHKLLLNRGDMIDREIDKVYMFYSEEQPNLFQKMRSDGVVHEFILGIPTMDFVRDITATNMNILIIIDDNMKNVDEDMSELFTTFRHRNASLLFLTQNLFQQNRDYRTMSLNANYITIMKNPRDSSQIMSFAKQFSPGNTRFVVDAFRNATTNKAHSYVLFDLRQETPDNVRMRTNIFPDEAPMSAYARL